MNKLDDEMSDTGPLIGVEMSIVLDRVASFFLAAGVSANAIERQLLRSLSIASKQTSKVKFVAQRDFPALERIVNHWLKHSNYVNAAGRPKPLPISGTQSVASIIRETGFDGSANIVVKSLVELGAVAKNSDATYSLTARHCNWNAEGIVAYEPHAAFLMNAVVASTHAIGRSKSKNELFWRASGSDRIPTSLAKKYVEFARVRGTSLLRELDDWLGQHEVAPNGRDKKAIGINIGVGLFPFIQSYPVGKSIASTKKQPRQRRALVQVTKSKSRSMRAGPATVK